MSQSWQPTNLTNVTYLAITGMESHQGELYSTVFNGFTATLNKLNSDQSSWTEMTVTGITGSPRFMQSAGNKLYLTTIHNLAYSMVYYTIDGGSTYILDTVGLPQSGQGVITLAYGIQLFDHIIILNMGSAGYYYKDLNTGMDWDKIDVPTALNGGSDPLVYYNGSFIAYDNTGIHTLYVSTNEGQTWEARVPAMGNDYSTVVSGFILDQSNGRIYSYGQWNSLTQHGIFYTDDNGLTWNQANAATALLGNNNNGQLQQVTAGYANGQTVYFALQNNQEGSVIDVIGTASGIDQISFKTDGLPSSSPAAINGVKFGMHQGKLAMQCNVSDIYLYGLSSGLNEFHPETLVFPNPGAGNFTIQSLLTPELVLIKDLSGKLITRTEISQGKFNLDALATGIYMADFIKNNTILFTTKLVKE